MTELRHIIFDTTMGWVGILGSDSGLLSVTLPRPSFQEAQQQLGQHVNQAVWAPQSFESIMERLRIYFSGYKADFPDTIDLSWATPFQRKVLELTRLIPYGETRSYAWLAHQIRRPRAARAVGQALSRNPLPVIIPCHRVLNSDGLLGGYTGGLELKKYLLSLEAPTCRG